MSLPLADELLLLLATPDRRSAAQQCAALIRSGMPLERLVDEGLARAMTQVGSLWASAVWSVVDEHTATAVAEAGLSAAAAEVRASGGSRGEVLLACVEGDWHSLAARMVAEVLAARRWSVRFLGASQPTDQLVDHLARHRPQVVLLSCAVPMALPALMGAVQAIHDLDLPVYVGGRALGKTSRRAEAVGADGWAASSAGAADLLDRGPVPAPTDLVAERLAAWRASQALLPAWTVDATRALAARMPDVNAYPKATRDRASADLLHLLHLLDMASVGLLLRDETLLDEQCAWLQGVLAARGVPSAALAHGLAALRQTRPDGEHPSRIESALRQAGKNLSGSSAQRQPACGG